ncbi:MAG: cobalamin-dependent protein [Bacillota bacterium]|nr:cobalamin-dependent protein [Bacillota bacterium]
MINQDILSIQDAVIHGQANKVKILTQIAMDKGNEINNILNVGLIDPLQAISKKLKNNEIYIADVIIVSRAVHAGLHVLEPFLESGETRSRGRVVIGTVAGDLHDIGKNLVAMTMTSLGLEVIDLGVDIYPDEFVEAVKKYKPDLLALSAMLTTTVNVIAETIHELEVAGVRKSVKVLIGGNPVTADFRFTSGSDGTCQELREIEDMIRHVKPSLFIK